MSVFITGASSGIGEACAWEFARRGRDLVLMARREARLTELADAIRKKHPVSITTVTMDVRDRAGLERWVKANPKVVEQVSVLVNNAGLALGLDALPTGNPDDWDTMIDTNIKGVLYVTRQLLPALTAKRGHIVNIGSVAGQWTYPKGNVYCATKFAIHGLNQAMRQDLHGTGVRVTEISPGMVETEFSDVRHGGDREAARKIYNGLQPLSASDIAEAVAWSVERPAHVNIQEMVIFPTAQSAVGLVHRTSAP
jgi:NADP-dependent 3-hydroxy acid dehydrogenase YdfG